MMVDNPLGKWAYVIGVVALFFFVFIHVYYFNAINTIWRDVAIYRSINITYCRELLVEKLFTEGYPSPYVYVFLDYTDTFKAKIISDGMHELLSQRYSTKYRLNETEVKDFLYCAYILKDYDSELFKILYNTAKKIEDEIHSCVVSCNYNYSIGDGDG